MLTCYAAATTAGNLSRALHWQVLPCVNLPQKPLLLPPLWLFYQYLAPCKKGTLQNTSYYALVNTSPANKKLNKRYVRTTHSQLATATPSSWEEGAPVGCHHTTGNRKILPGVMLGWIPPGFWLGSVRAQPQKCWGWGQGGHPALLCPTHRCCSPDPRCPARIGSYTIPTHLIKQTRHWYSLPFPSIWWLRSILSY